MLESEDKIRFEQKSKRGSALWRKKNRRSRKGMIENRRKKQGRQAGSKKESNSPAEMASKVPRRHKTFAMILIGMTLLLPFWSSACLPIMQWAFSDYLQSNGLVFIARKISSFHKYREILPKFGGYRLRRSLRRSIVETQLPISPWIIAVIIVSSVLALGMIFSLITVPSSSEKAMLQQSVKYTAYSTSYFNSKKSEACEEKEVRFICPRQNEPREFLYCCNNTCCADETQSRFFKNSSETEIKEIEQNKTSISGALWQAVIILYVFVVFLIMLADFFSHMRLKNKKSASIQKPSTRQLSADS
ncbi:unnamed protein product [Oikopleura dioica]|uniref:Uncharacterized protein n=1 Tax=Oikopleura dioica TaxID=34765 RepID=E4YBZ7_OIKDI|nr:unnamed protein product [Oikopleura dioica]